jgi:Fe2+ transport system protein FeoA
MDTVLANRYITGNLHINKRKDTQSANVAQSLTQDLTQSLTQDLTQNLTQNLSQAKISTEYVIKDVRTNDRELKDFLFTLGCYEGETITVISILADNYIISVKDARYSIDKDLARLIII